MSRELDFNRLDEDDLQYIAQRPWIAEEAKRQGIDLDNLDEVEGDEEDEAVDYHELTVDELRNELARRGLSTGGRKDELIERLEENDQA